MKVLFYGGCHAAALQRLFDREALGDHEFRALINFRLIQSGNPFPYEDLAGYDAVVFSPIRNPEYSTNKLIEACRGLGVKTVSYPWLHWQALFPFITKGPFLGGLAWHYGAVFEREPMTPEAFHDAAFGDRFDAAILENFTLWHQELANLEKEFEVDLPVTGFIMENYRKVRLFLTPDHPTRVLYEMLVVQLAERLEIRLSPGFRYSADEPQRGIKTPIMPRVSDLLDLSYRDSDYEDINTFGARSIPWRDYCALYRAADAEVFAVQSPTVLKVSPRPEDRARSLPCHKGDVLVAKVLGKRSDHLEVQPLYFSGRRNLAPDEPRYIFQPHWQRRVPGLTA